MKYLRSIVEFFADDLLTAGLLIGWVIIGALLSKAFNHITIVSLGYAAGIVAILVFGTVRRAMTQR